MEVKLVLIAATVSLLLSACEQREEGVYGEPIPDPSDKSAQAQILDQLEGEDRQAWSNIMIRMGAADVLGIESGSVREAVEKEKIRAECTSDEDYTDEVKACMSQPI